MIFNKIKNMPLTHVFHASILSTKCLITIAWNELLYIHEKLTLAIKKEIENLN